MSESLEGVSVAATRQNAGKAPYCRACPSDSDRPAGIGGAKAPAATASEAVIVTLGSDNEANVSHATAGLPATAAPTSASGMGVVDAVLQAATTASTAAALNESAVVRRCVI